MCHTRLLDGELARVEDSPFFNPIDLLDQRDLAAETEHYFGPDRVHFPDIPRVVERVTRDEPTRDMVRSATMGHNGEMIQLTVYSDYL